MFEFVRQSGVAKLGVASLAISGALFFIGYLTGQPLSMNKLRTEQGVIQQITKITSSLSSMGAKGVDEEQYVFDVKVKGELVAWGLTTRAYASRDPISITPDMVSQIATGISDPKNGELYELTIQGKQVLRYEDSSKYIRLQAQKYLQMSQISLILGLLLTIIGYWLGKPENTQRFKVTHLQP